MNELIKGQPTLDLDTLDAWTQWLKENHLSSVLVWMRIRKRASKKKASY